MPSPFEKLQRYIRLESERGYDNRAVVGGLDKIIPWWEPEARTSSVSEETLQAILVHLRAYPKAGNDERPRLVVELEKLLEPLSKLPRPDRISRPPQPKQPSRHDQPERSSRPNHVTVNSWPINWQRKPDGTRFHNLRICTTSFCY